MKALEIIEVENGFIVFEGCSNDPSTPPGTYGRMRRKWVAASSVELGALIEELTEVTDTTDSATTPITQRA